ncbi:hypothetical protein HAX54_023654, partial [Datura stramonium]|nr:hypothetical protein [Datura stramonium]
MLEKTIRHSLFQDQQSRQEDLRGDDMRGMIHDAFGIFIQLLDDNISEREEIEPNVEDNTRHPSRNQPNPEVDKFEQLVKDSNEKLYPECKKF